jgi:tight adherence protein B
MFGFDLTIIAFIGLATLGVGGLIFAFMYDSVANENRQAKRVNSIKQRDVAQASKTSQRINDAAKRRKTVQDSLKELEDKQKSKHNKKLTLKRMLVQAGLGISVKTFFIFSLVFGVLATVVAVFLGAGMYAIAGTFLVATFGFPRWVVSFKRKKRFKAFLQEFPNAVDVIVRGVKAGLPLNDCLAIIAREAKDPVRSEFAKVIESQKMGVPMSEAITKLYDNIPLTEANFFGIVVAIQQSAGGNLSEALGNLSNVLRDRKKLDGKIKAMSAEAKASAGIIGSLPFCVCILIYLTTPDYITLLFTHETGHMILVGAGIWMSMGIMVMRKMINFDF